MALERFELLELRRDDGVQIFHAREVSTARPVQVHLFSAGSVPENLALLSRLNRLPEPDRRRVIDRGISLGRPYVVTERLAGFANLREWVDSKTAPEPAPPSTRSLDQQFFDLFDSAEPQMKPQPLMLEGDPPESGIPFAAMALGVVVAVLFVLFLIALVAFRRK